jgi:hypothetical protein
MEEKRCENQLKMPMTVEWAIVLGGLCANCPAQASCFIKNTSVPSGGSTLAAGSDSCEFPASLEITPSRPGKSPYFSITFPDDCQMRIV